MFKILAFAILISFVHGQSGYEQPEPEPYTFAFSSATDDGATMAREENQDRDGRVTGFYTVDQPDGSRRRVEYIADANGFRAKVVTNEMGTTNSFPADVVMESSAPNTRGYLPLAANDRPVSKTSFSNQIDQIKDNQVRENIPSAPVQVRRIPAPSSINVNQVRESAIISSAAPVTQVRTESESIDNQVREIPSPAPIITQIRNEPSPSAVKSIPIAAPAIRPLVTPTRQLFPPRPTLSQAQRQQLIRNQVSRPVLISNQVRNIQAPRQNGFNSFSTVSPVTPIPTKPTRFAISNTRTILSNDNGRGDGIRVIGISRANNGQTRTLGSLLNSPLYTSNDVQTVENTVGNYLASDITSQVSELNGASTGHYLRYYLIPVRNGQTLRDAVESYASRS